MRKKARIERYALVYHINNPPEDPPLWAAWDEGPTNGLGNLVAMGRTLAECERQCRWLLYDTRIFLRAGDDGKERSITRLRVHQNYARKRNKLLSELTRLYQTQVRGLT